MNIEFEADCFYDFLQISTSEGSLKLCGNLSDYSKNTGPICIHTGSHLLDLEFKSDSLQSGTGFSLSFYIELPENFSEDFCGKFFNRSDFHGYETTRIETTLNPRIF